MDSNKSSTDLKRRVSGGREPEQKGGYPMVLRGHPLFSYHGMHSWPPTWTWIAGLDNKHPKGEIGILRKVQESNVQPSNRCFLYMDFDDSSYLGCLLCAEHTFCTQIVRILEANLNKPIRQIGSLDISRLL